MSILDGKGSGGGSRPSVIKGLDGNPIKLWNYSSDKDKEGNPIASYKEELTGTVVDMAEAQATKYGTDELEFWSDGSPKMNIEMAIQQDNGEELVWHFSPGSLRNEKKMSKARKALIDEIRRMLNDPVTIDMLPVIGMKVTVKTKKTYTADGQEIKYGAGFTRPWEVTIHGPGNAEAVRFGKSVEAPAPAPVQETPMSDTNIPF